MFKMLSSLFLVALFLGSPTPAKSQEFFSGGFMLSATNNRLLLIDPPLPEASWMSLNCNDIANDTEYARYRITTPTGQVIAPFND